MKHTITELAKATADFSHYRDGNLYYKINLVADNVDIIYTFPIDTTNTEDIGNAKFEASYEKALPLMRYIRKSIDNNTMLIKEL